MTEPFTCYRCHGWPCECRDGVTLICGDCREVLPRLDAGSVDLVLTDPPYFKVKGDWWDRQWDKPETFLAWMGGLCDQWRRVLKPNGSLYVFASPQMAHGVEAEVRQRFNVLTNIRWRKPPFSTKAEMFDKDDLRAPFPASETILFSEHYGADNIAKGEAGYGAKCDELRGFVFEPLRAYLAGERDRAGWTNRRVAERYQQKTGSRTVTGMAGHWFEQVQWALPTAENYGWLRSLFNTNGTEYLRREYEDLRREYEDLRRPFNVTADDAYTDVWDFATVGDYPGKHPCEKPADMIRQIVKASSRPGAVVLDCFAGCGVVGQVCAELGRRAILVDVEDHWCRQAARRIEFRSPEPKRVPKPMPLFSREATR